MKDVENKQVKVYLSRDSVCAADDVNCPNPATFYLPDTIDEFILIMDKMLPFKKWRCYLGEYRKGIVGAEDGILVWKEIDNHVLISSYKNNNNNEFIVTHDSDWYETIKAHPYLYFERCLD